MLSILVSDTPTPNKLPLKAYNYVRINDEENLIGEAIDVHEKAADDSVLMLAERSLEISTDVEA